MLGVQELRTPKGVNFCIFPCMLYSVVSRFRGTLVGLFLGENLASNHQSDRSVVRSAESLIKLGRFDLEDWLQGQQQEFEDLHPSESDVLLASLPIILFFHEDINKLREILLRLVKVEDEPVLQDAILALGYAIAQCLKEKFNPLTIIPQTVSFLPKTSLISENLLTVNNLFVKSAGLERVEAQLSQTNKLSQTIAMAFYCFISTPEDFRLSVLQANRVKSCSQIISAITGALSGTHNNISGIPVTWLLKVSQGNLSPSPSTNLSRMIKLADALVAVWSGVYDLASEGKEYWLLSSAIASQGIIR